MKFWSLLRANLGRHKRRTFLTIASVAMALFLFASLRTVITTITAAAQFGSARRLVTTNASGFVLPLPVSYANRLSAMQGIEKVTWANWFGGRYGDGKKFFAIFAIDPKSYLEIYPEMVVPADQREGFLQDKGGALVGSRLVKELGWTVGQNVKVEGTIYPGEWTFTVRGVYTPSDKSIDDAALMFHYDYLDERNGKKGNVGWYITEIDHPANAAQIARGIDDQFRSSPAPTKSGTEQAFNASFATMWGNIGLLMNTIGLAVVFAILLVTANAMMMSARERTRELAVLKTIGYSDRLLFGLVLAEAGIITLTGAALGLGTAKLLYRATNFNAGGMLPGFDVTWATVWLGGVIAFVLMLASGIIPAAQAARLPVVAALRNVE